MDLKPIYMIYHLFKHVQKFSNATGREESSTKGSFKYSLPWPGGQADLTYWPRLAKLRENNYSNTTKDWNYSFLLGQMVIQ